MQAYNMEKLVCTYTISFTKSELNYVGGDSSFLYLEMGKSTILIGKTGVSY